MIATRYTIRVIAATAVLSLAAGCQQYEPSKQDIGMATRVLGTEVGHGSGRPAPTIPAAELGAFLGSAVGKSMDRTDQLATAHALETSQTGRSTSWRNPDSGHAYTVTPTRTYETASGPCREFNTDAQIGGRTEQVHGTACRQADGSWSTL